MLLKFPTVTLSGNCGSWDFHLLTQDLSSFHRKLTSHAGQILVAAENRVACELLSREIVYHCNL